MKGISVYLTKILSSGRPIVWTTVFVTAALAQRSNGVSNLIPLPPLSREKDNVLSTARDQG